MILTALCRAWCVGHCGGGEKRPLSRLPLEGLVPQSLALPYPHGGMLYPLPETDLVRDWLEDTCKVPSIRENPFCCPHANIDPKVLERNLCPSSALPSCFSGDQSSDPVAQPLLPSIQLVGLSSCPPDKADTPGHPHMQEAPSSPAALHGTQWPSS